MENILNGLSDKEVLERENKALINISNEKITKSTTQIFKDNILTLFNAFNLIIGIALASVSAWTNMVYLLIIFLNIAIGIYQELHAKKLVENLSLISSPIANVVRNSKETEILAEKVVIDDILILTSGQQICCDCQIIDGTVEVNESFLTGESEPIIKKVGEELLSGSFIVSGKCFVKAIRVGNENFIAKLANDAKKHKKINSALYASMRKVTKFTGFFIAPLGILLFLEAFFLRNESRFDSVVFTSAGLLGMLPKGLVLIISISLATGVIKLSRRKVLVQQMQCIEKLADVDIICLDKTGTITDSKLKVTNVFSKKLQGTLDFETAIKNFLGATDDNNATFIALKDKFGIDTSIKPIDKIPFSSSRKFSSVTFAEYGEYILGAPEKFFSILPDNIKSIQKDGKRVICFASINNLEKCTIIELEDSIRPNAEKTLDFFRKEGVTVKIISGDNPITVSEIAKRAGFLDYNSYIDLSETKSDKLSEIAFKYNIFGRVTPSQKRDLVKTLQENGHTVAMTGDGVNDVLALREADCSISISEGSEAAKQISHLVLLDNDFGSLPLVVMEGRRVINNITKIASVFFIKTIYSAILCTFALILNTPFPFFPIQITLLDAAIEAYPGFFLSFEPDTKRPKGQFLNIAFITALPFALLICICFTFITIFSNQIPNPLLLMYYLVGFISSMALFKACRPFNKLRVFLFATSSVGFFTAAYLFNNILKIERLNLNGWIYFAVSSVICIPLLILIKKLIFLRAVSKQKK